jgi:hypothetical protein
MRDPYLATGYYPKVFHPNDPDYEKYATGFKAMNLNMTCRNKQYEIGQTYTEEGPLVICEHGMHYCTEIGNIFSFYQPTLDENGSLNFRVFKVHSEGDIVVEFSPENEPIKCATLVLRIDDEIPQEELINTYHIKNQTITTFTYYNTYDTQKEYTFSITNRREGKPSFWSSLNRGDCNHGFLNVGYSNHGHNNDGSQNYGYRNCGDHNHGDFNSGSCNHGDYNIGALNMGDGNLGSQNMGNYNCGFANIGSFNKTSHAIGYFNTQPGIDIMFNKPIPKDMRFDNASSIKRTLINQVLHTAYLHLSEQEHEAIEHILNGYSTFDFLNGALVALDPRSTMVAQECVLKIFEKLSSYRTEAFRQLSAETKQQIEALPNFDRKIFAECTGIAETAFDD